MTERDSRGEAALLVAECRGCGRIAWPPRVRCPRCLGVTRVREAAPEGRVVEYSGRDDYFCVAEFEGGIRLICSADAEPAVGQAVTLKRVERDGSGYRFSVSAVR